MGKIVAKLRQAVTIQNRKNVPTSHAWLERRSGMDEQKEKSHIPGAAARAFLVVILAVFPAVVIPSTTPETAQSLVLLALFAGGIVMAEYASDYPGIIEFRFAAPFNRTRFALIALIAVLLSFVQRHGVDSGYLSGLASSVAAVCGDLLDFPFSPVRLLLAALPETVAPEQLAMIRDGASLALILSATTVAGFFTAIRLNAWPMGQGPFNVWINLPTFDPTAGNDVVLRLQRHARINVVLGLVLPFVLPVAIIASALLIKPLTLSSPMEFVWGLTLWAYLPAAMVMRGIAMNRVAKMIRASRRRFADSEGNAFATA